jgi:hypothetical protein
VIVGELDGRWALTTGGSTGMALAGATLFVETRAVFDFLIPAGRWAA